MKTCNVCKKKRPDWLFKTEKKKTCRKCEYNWWRDILRMMVRDRRLTPIERLATRAGYMGVGFLIAGQWTVEPILFILLTLFDHFVCYRLSTPKNKFFPMLMYVTE